MKNYRPLLFQELDVRLPGAHVRRLRLNRHLPEVDTLAEHSHPFSQILCYLSGRGSMSANNRSYDIGPASIVFLPPRSEHSFHESTGRRPLCLVLDGDWRGAVKKGVLLGRLSQAEATQIRRELSDLTKLPDPHSPSCRFLVAAVVLRIVDSLFRGLDLLPSRNLETPPFVRQFEKLIRQPAPARLEISDLAARMGYQTDYLNRIFKQATGQTLREFRDSILLDRAKRLLRTSVPVWEVGDELGFADQNYFARWFKKHTGLQPRVFRTSSGS